MRTGEVEREEPPKRNAGVRVREKMGHYFRTAGETVKRYFVLLSLTQPSVTRSHLHVEQLIFSKFLMHL